MHDDTPMMENQPQKKMDNEMEVGVENGEKGILQSSGMTKYEP